MDPLLDRLITTLTALVIEGRITEAEAQLIIERYAAGDIPDAWIPLQPSVIIAPPSDEDRANALLILGAILRQPMRGIPFDRRVRIVDGLQDRFAEQVAVLARDHETGGALGDWEVRMAEQIRAHLLAAAMLARGDEDVPLVLVEDESRRQAAFLVRFADEIALGAITGAALSLERIAARSALYSGPMRGIFFRENEAAAVQGGDLDEGWVIQYIARDDNRTCTPCHEAQGYYLPGEGPFPGDVCLGGGYCRCRRVRVYDPQIYARLIRP